MCECECVCVCVCRTCASIAAHHQLGEVFDNIVISLCKFTTLLDSHEVLTFDPNHVHLYLSLSLRVRGRCVLCWDPIRRCSCVCRRCLAWHISMETS